MELKEKVISGLKWSVGGKFSVQLFSWASTIFVMRLLHPDDYGLIAMASVFLALCLLLNEMGLAGALVQMKDFTETIQKQAFGVVLLLNGFLFLLLLAGASMIAGYFEEPRLNELVPVLAIQFLIIAFSVIPGAALTREMNFRAISISEMVSALLSSLVTLGMAWIGYGVWALVIGSLTGIIVRTVGLNIASPFFKLPSWNYSGFGKTVKFGGWISLNRVLWYIYSQADVFIAGKILGKTALGYYSVAMHIASLPMQKVGGILHVVGLPAYSKLQDDIELAGTYVLKASRTISFVAFPMFLGISCVAPELVTLALGDRWLLAILPMQLLSIVVPLRTLSISLAPAVTGLGKPDVNVKTLAVACIIMPISFYVGSQWGLKGLSIAWVVGYSLWFVFMLSRVLPVLGLSFGQFFRTIQGPALVSAAMYALVYIARKVVSAWELPVAALLGIFIVVGAITYSAGMLLFYHNTCKEMWNLRRN